MPSRTASCSTPQSEQDGLTRPIERLQARLGPAQVQRLEAVADHRPERASRLYEADACRRPASARAARSKGDTGVDITDASAVRPV
jgi:protein ImuB